MISSSAALRVILSRVYSLHTTKTIVMATLSHEITRMMKPRFSSGVRGGLLAEMSMTFECVFEVFWILYVQVGADSSNDDSSIGGRKTSRFPMGL